MRFAYHVGIISLLGSMMATAGAAGLEVVAYKGMATGLSGVSFDFFAYPPTMNSSGELAFCASLSGTGVTSSNRDAIWKGVPGSFSLVTREGNAAPDTTLYFGNGTDALYPFSNLTLNSAGSVAFVSSLQTALGANAPSQSNESIWTTAPGALSLAAREGSAAGSSGRNYASDWPRLALNSAGRLVFASRLSTGSGLLLRDSGGATQLLGLSGAQATGYAGGTYYGSFAYAQPVINFTGEIAVRHTLSNGVDAILGITGGSLQPLVQYGAPLSPGSALSFAGLSQPSINNGGYLAFQANLFGADNSNNTAVVVGKGNSFAIAAREGVTVPGIAAQYAFTYSTRGEPNVMIGGGGHIAFEAPLAGTGVTGVNDLALVGGLPGDLHVLGRKGDQAVGLPAGFLYEDFGAIYVNAGGQIAFAGTASNGVGGLYSAFWLGSPEGETSLIASTGSLVEIGGSMYELSSVYWTGTGSGGQDGGASALTDDGRLAFLANYDSNRGNAIIVFSVPEPGTFAGAAAALVLLQRRRRRCGGR